MKQVPLADIILGLESGQRPRGGAAAVGDVPSLGGEHLRDDGGFRLDNLKWVSQDFFDNMKAGRVSARDILIVKDGATTGRTCFVGDDFPFSVAGINEHVFRLQVDPSLAWPKYVYHYLRSMRGRHQILSDFRGATVGGISRGFVRKVLVPLPPLDVQRSTAKILDEADELEAKRSRTLELLDDLTQSIFLDTFSENLSERVPIRRLADVVREGTDVTYGIVQAGPEIPGGVPYVKTGNIVDGVIRIEQLSRTSNEIAARYKRSTLEVNDIVMSIRATVGTTALVPAALSGANLTQGTARIAPGKDVLPIYLLEFLRSRATQNWIQRQVKGATFREITLTRLRDLPVAVPSMAQQIEFARRMDSTSRLGEVVSFSANCIREQRQSLLQAAFSGKL